MVAVITLASAGVGALLGATTERAERSGARRTSSFERMRISSLLRSAIRLTIVAVLTSGCSLITTGDCVDVGVSGIRVTVLDQRTRQSPSGATVTLADGDYRETLIGSGGVYNGAIERPGTYSITVEAPGFSRWTRDNVRVVRSGRCNYLKSVAVTSDLQPTG